MKHSILNKLGKAHAGPWLTGGMLVGALCACSSSGVTPQLKDARAAYEEADNSQVRKDNPRELERARIALERAEAAHDDNPGSEREIQWAQRAEYRAHAAMARADGDDVVARRHAARVNEVDADRAVAHEESVRAQTVRTDAAPVPEKAPTKAEERKAAAALQNLNAVANVKEEPRGVVITLSGSLLFPNGKEQISPIAEKNLDQVAHALAQQPPSTTFQVAGHTDNSGSENQNKQLAQERAQAVADHLVQAGIDASRIRVVGYGEKQPIADNTTPEGRASNRRVEIVAKQHQG